MEKITLYYFIAAGSLTLGRGENVKLFLVDAGLDHEYIRIENREKEWPPMREQLVQDGYYAVSAPYIKLGDKVFGRTIPIMRYLSIKLGRKYHGTNDEEDYHLDVVSDLTNDWFESLKNSFFGDEEKKKHHAEVERPNWLSKFEKYYSDNEGPYLLGNRITYVDFLVYHLIDDDDARTRLDEYPNLKLFAETFEERPNINKYLASLK
ncbi:hypothetical protein G6F62_000660 [Rhizopus arrhizus]|uniref:Glutathione S-transferase n=1 Tax=Rhizopus oryzae TaxID=64495 RepID=A0A9P7BUH4_RHIOR|nr:hypothetical protein G6F23_006016 [Rhizopus arrhizus]KAG0798053.1 hypothetical protein G6F21_000044 [Rhizopus arrhizus]KAG0798441.1 hypothetical protein G6F22_004223 [Rhizopus arrhizus]KAG0817401.1 hypothetical protein G6F20_002410 [Rhizopus arrhizus]KAG0842174.1 hypothetical protein G6F19_001139 [Rhizopus arrhizus]